MLVGQTSACSILLQIEIYKFIKIVWNKLFIIQWKTRLVSKKICFCLLKLICFTLLSFAGNENRISSQSTAKGYNKVEKQEFTKHRRRVARWFKITVYKTVPQRFIMNAKKQSNTFIGFDSNNKSFFKNISFKFL